MTETGEQQSLTERLEQATQQCRQTVWHTPRTPAEVLDGLADACRELDIEEWDFYGDGGAVERLESEVEALLGRPAAYFPSGTMAQQVALRVHTERAGTRRVAMPDLSHLLHHEEDGPRVLQGLQVEHLTRGRTAPTREHLEAVHVPLAAVLVELPLRDAGCLLPTFEELEELAATVHDRGAAFHVDGARIWESQPHLGRPLPEIAALTDSLYVSFYKGLGGLSGAALVGDAELLAEARQWRRRMGGTVYRTAPEAVAALVGLRDRLPMIPDLVAWGRELAAALPAHITVQPTVPHINTFHLYAAGDPDQVNARLLAMLEEHGVAFSRSWHAADEPGRVWTEVTVGDGALALEPDAVAAYLGELVGP